MTGCASWEWGLCVGIGCSDCNPEPPRYPCPTCGGNGCASCGGTGERTDTSHNCADCR